MMVGLRNPHRTICRFGAYLRDVILPSELGGDPFSLPFGFDTGGTHLRGQFEEPPFLCLGIKFFFWG